MSDKKPEVFECEECGEIAVTSVWNTKDKWIATCANCGDEQSYP